MADCANLTARMTEEMRHNIAAALGMKYFIHPTMPETTKRNVASALGPQALLHDAIPHETKSKVAAALGAGWLYNEDLKTARRPEPLVAPDEDHPVATLSVFRPGDATHAQKRPLPDQDASVPAAKRLAATPSTPGASQPQKVEVVEIPEDDDDDEGDATAAEDSKSPDHGYDKAKNTLFRYHQRDDHPRQWPGPGEAGLRFDVARFMRDFGWPAKDAMADFAREFAEGGKDLYLCADSDQDAGLSKDSADRGWQLAAGNQLIRGLPLVEDVVFVLHGNYCKRGGMTPGICYWTAMAIHLYGDARFWLRVKAEHLEHFARVLGSETHPRHELYRELNSKWYQVIASPKPGSKPAPGTGRKISLNLWQVLNLPGVYTPMEMLDVTADLYGLYMVVYSFHLVDEAARRRGKVGPYEQKVYKTVARGAYNARHLGLLFVNGNHFQPIIPNDYIHWEFKFPRITQARTASFARTGKNEGVTHPWRSEFPPREAFGGQQAPAIVDRGFDPSFAAAAVGYPLPHYDGEDDEGEETPGSGRTGDSTGDGGSQDRAENGGLGDNDPGSDESGDGDSSDDSDNDEDDTASSNRDDGDKEQLMEPASLRHPMPAIPGTSWDGYQYLTPLLDPPPGPVHTARANPAAYVFDAEEKEEAAEEEELSTEDDDESPADTTPRQTSPQQPPAQASVAPPPPPAQLPSITSGTSDPEVISLRRQIAELREQNRELFERIDKLAEDNATVHDLTVQVSEQQRKIEALQAEALELNATIADLNNQELQEDLARARSNLEAREKELATIQADLSRAREDLAQTQRDLAEARKELAQARERHDSARQELVELDHQHQGTLRQNSTFQQEITHLAQEVEQLRQQTAQPPTRSDQAPASPLQNPAAPAEQPPIPPVDQPEEVPKQAQEEPAKEATKSDSEHDTVPEPAPKPGPRQKPKPGPKPKPKPAPKPAPPQKPKAQPTRPPSGRAKKVAEERAQREAEAAAKQAEMERIAEEKREARRKAKEEREKKAREEAEEQASVQEGEEEEEEALQKQMNRPASRKAVARGRKRKTPADDDEEYSESPSPPPKRRKPAADAKENVEPGPSKAAGRGRKR